MKAVKMALPALQTEEKGLHMRTTMAGHPGCRPAITTRPLRHKGQNGSVLPGKALYKGSSKPRNVSRFRNVSNVNNNKPRNVRNNNAMPKASASNPKGSSVRKDRSPNISDLKGHRKVPLREGVTKAAVTRAAEGQKVQDRAVADGIKRYT